MAAFCREPFCQHTRELHRGTRHSIALKMKANGSRSIYNLISNARQPAIRTGRALVAKAFVPSILSSSLCFRSISRPPSHPLVSLLESSTHQITSPWIAPRHIELNHTTGPHGATPHRATPHTTPTQHTTLNAYAFMIDVLMNQRGSVSTHEKCTQAPIAALR